MNRVIRLACVLSCVVLASAAVASAQDTLVAARQLYGSAAYDEALAMLDRLKAQGQAAGDGLAVDQYRAFCLMALGRQSDAVQAVEAVVGADPSYVPNEADVSPRVVTAFHDARLRLLPALAQQRYQAARALYDRKDYAAALGGFEATLRLIAAPDLAEAAGAPPLSDLRMLVVGFRDLAAAAAAPPPKPVEVKPAAPAPPPPPPPKPFYTAEDEGVTAPVVVSQRIPPWPAARMAGFARSSSGGLLEILINEQGGVDAAIMARSIARVYDDMLVNAAKSWSYKPALKDNVPVKFRKTIRINVQ